MISGGGSKGAYAGGVAEYLINNENKKYDILAGTSTGSLLIPHLAIGEIRHIKQVYLNVTQRDIYNINPFRTSINKNGDVKFAIHHLNIVKMFLKGKSGFGDHKNLRKTISKFLLPEHFERMKSCQKKIFVTAANLTTAELEYKFLADYNRDDFIDWLWISSSFVPFMSPVKKNGFEYADGGFGDFVPIMEAINAGATEVDAIVLNPRHKKKENWQGRNGFDLIMRAMYFMNKQIAHDDLLLAGLESIYNKNVKVNFFFTPRQLTSFSFHFDKRQMTKWWDEGFEDCQRRCLSSKV